MPAKWLPGIWMPFAQTERTILVLTAVPWTRWQTVTGRCLPSSCIENHGYNVIRLNVPDAGATITANFEGVAGAAGYNAVNVHYAGWRYGYVALQNDGTRIYSDVFSASSGTASFTCPENCSDIWFVVSGAPTSYWQHAWDEDGTNDEQWPYKVKFDGANIYGVIEFTEDDQPHDTTFVYNVSFPADATAYSGKTVSVDVVKLCYAFVLSATEITSNIGLPSSSKKIKFYGVNKDGSMATTTTANGYGHWFNAAGDVCPWVSGTTGTNMVFSEFDETNFIFHWDNILQDARPETYIKSNRLWFIHR